MHPRTFKHIYEYRYIYSCKHIICYSSQIVLFAIMFALLIEWGKLFQIEGPIRETAFCSMFVLRNGFLSLEKLFLVPMLQYEANSKISFR